MLGKTFLLNREISVNRWHLPIKENKPHISNKKPLWMLKIASADMIIILSVCRAAIFETQNGAGEEGLRYAEKTT